MLHFRSTHEIVGNVGWKIRSNMESKYGSKGFYGSELRKGTDCPGSFVTKSASTFPLHNHWED